MPPEHADKDWLDLFFERMDHGVHGPAEREAMAHAALGAHCHDRRAVIAAPQGSAHIHLVASGWAARVCTLADASRQITGFALPGELCDLSRLDDWCPEAVEAVTQCEVILLDRDRMLGAIRDHPRLGVALLGLALREQAVLREWLLCLGRRTKREHLAHLLCELHHRLRQSGLVDDDAFALPLTQEQLGEATGMTVVHANRILQQLRREGIISLAQQHLRIHQLQRLMDIAQFDGSYLRS